MKIRALFTVSTLFLMQWSLALVGLAQVSRITQTPLLPNTAGTYYYEGFDSVNNRHAYVSNTGTYYYVDTSGITTVGGQATIPVSTPYRAVITAGGTASFQFNNAHGDLYTINTGTSYAVRSGTWLANDVTFTITSTIADAAAIWAAGYTGTVATPVTFSGTNVSAIVATSDTSNRQALAIVNGASAYLYGGTLSKTHLATTNASETILMVSNQEKLGSSSFFHGEDLTIISSGNTLETFNMAGGHNTAELYRSTITSTLGNNGPTAVIQLNGTPELGGNKFYGENILINVTGTTANRVISLGGTGVGTDSAGTAGSGSNTIILISSTINANIGGKTLAQEIIFLNDSMDTGGNHFRGENLTINNDQGPTFGIDYGANTITLKNSKIKADGKGAVFRWNGSETVEGRSDAFTSTVTLENTNVETTADYAPVFYQVGRLGAATVTGGTITTTGIGSPIIRLVGANDSRDKTAFMGIFTNAVLDAQNASAIDLDLGGSGVDNTANYGWGGAGGKEVTTAIRTAWDLIFISSTLNGTSAFRIANAGNAASPYYNTTRVSVYDSAINGSINMTLTGNGDTTGAYLILQGTNSVFTGGFYITGTEGTRYIHKAELYLRDSSFRGDLVGTNNGDLVVDYINTPITGNLAFSGSTHTYLNLINSSISGGITLAGTARLENNPGLDLNGRPATLRNSAIGGGFNLSGASFVNLTLSGQDAIVSGGVIAKDSATAILRFEDNASMNGGVTLSGSASVSFVLSNADQISGDLVVNDRAHLTISSFAGTPVHLNRGLTLAGIWSIPTKTTLERPLDITHYLGTINIVTAAKDSLVLKSGLTGNGRLDIGTIDSSILRDSEFRVIHDQTNTFAPDALILAHAVEFDLAAYTLENRPDGAYLVGGLAAGYYGTGGAAVFNSQALVVEDWFASLTPVNNRLAELRQTNIAKLSGNSGGSAPAHGDAGTFWLQARADTTQVEVGNKSLDFNSRTIGITAGVDARWDYDTAALSTGIFADTARIDRDFIEAADGSTDSVGGGIYIHYQHRKGFFASVMGRFDTYENTLDTHSSNNAITANYSSQAGGVALDVGWRFDLGGTGWWFEPTYQLAFASMPGVSYATQAPNIINISTEDIRATQNLFRFAFGKVLGNKWSFHGHLAAATVDASGGEFSARRGDKETLNNLSLTLAGDRVEASIGMTRLIGRAGRLSINASYINADDYQRPCTFSLGYSHLW